MCGHHQKCCHGTALAVSRPQPVSNIVCIRLNMKLRKNHLDWITITWQRQQGLPSKIFTATWCQGGKPANQLPSLIQKETSWSFSPALINIVTDLLALTTCMVLQQGETTQFSPTLPAALIKLEQQSWLYKEVLHSQSHSVEQRVIRWSHTPTQLQVTAMQSGSY